MYNIEYITGVITGVILGIVTGVCIVNHIGISSDSFIKPEITIKCTNNKCDTTYLYKSK